MKRAPAAALLVLALGGASEGLTAPRIRAELPYGGRRQGEPVALRVAVENDGPPGVFELSAFTRGRPAQPVTRGEVELASGARKSVWLLAHVNRPELVIALSRDGRIEAETTLRLDEQPWSIPLAAVLGVTPPGLRRATREGPGTSDGGESLPRPPWLPGLHLVELEPAALPPEAALWPELDVLVWPAPLSHELEPRQARALRTWLRRGGLLVAGTNPEDPRALDTLGLMEDPGWGRVERQPEDLRRAGLARWRELLPPTDEPPAARRHGPASLARSAMERADGMVRPPVALSAALLVATLAGLGLVPAVRGYRARKGLAVRTPRVPPVAVLLVASSALALFLATGGPAGSLAYVRIDLLDVDAASGLRRGETFACVRRAWAGTLTVEAADGTQLSSPLGDLGSRPASDRELRHGFSLAADRLEATIDNWSSLAVRARWNPAALGDEPLPTEAESARVALGAERARLWSRGGMRALGAAAEGEGSAFDDAARLFSNRWWSMPEDEGLDSLVDSMVKAENQWRWPAGLRWREPSREAILVAVTEGAAGPPLRIDGELREPAAAWTVWRVRLPEGAQP